MADFGEKLRELSLGDTVSVPFLYRIAATCQLSALEITLEGCRVVNYERALERLTSLQSLTIYGLPNPNALAFVSKLTRLSCLKVCTHPHLRIGKHTLRIDKKGEK
jgi:hypothetical protein